MDFFIRLLVFRLCKCCEAQLHLSVLIMFLQTYGLHFCNHGLHRLYSDWWCSSNTSILVVEHRNGREFDRLKNTGDILSKKESIDKLCFCTMFKTRFQRSVTNIGNLRERQKVQLIMISQISKVFHQSCGPDFPLFVSVNRLLVKCYSITLSSVYLLASET